ncbi:MAG: thioredoxin family protein [Duodenibacillus sp.]|nr:thioredoxin family protein [Duodenibacillus sp.]
MTDSNGRVLVEVLGAGCATCHKQLGNARAAVAAAGLDAEVTLVTNPLVAMRYGVLSFPGVVVNKKVVSAGRLLSPEQTAALIARRLAG